MEASKIARLRGEQQRAIHETQENINQFEKYKSDYKALQKRLTTLPDKLSHDVMVPFGKLAFMPGKIVHTNEVLVLLGDNWFAERSAKQASDIASRRIKELDQRIKDLKDQQSLLQPRLGITSELQAQSEGQGDYKEIIEEYDDDKERLWDEQHKVNLRRHHTEMKRLRNENLKELNEVKSTMSEKIDEDLWSRLDALERQEDERGELNSSEDSDNDDKKDSRGEEVIAKGAHSRGEIISPLKDKRVNWSDEKKDIAGGGVGYDEDDGDRDGYDEDDDEEHDSDTTGDKSQLINKTITFTHTKTTADEPHQSHPITTEKPLSIVTPADIYKLFSPKPILKKNDKTRAKKDMPPGPDSSGDHVSLGYSLNPQLVNNQLTKRDSRFGVDTRKVVETSRDMAFTGIVKENPIAAVSLPQPPSVTQEQPKRVSKFKAQRMGQRPV